MSNNQLSLFRGSVLLGAFVVAVGCDRSPVGPTRDLRIVPLRGSGQLVAAHAELPIPLTVQVFDSGTAPARGVRIRFSLVRGARGGGVLLDTVAVTDFSGRASVGARAGDAGDTLRVEAAIAFLPGYRVRFTAVAGAAPTIVQSPRGARAAGDTVTIAVSGAAGVTKVWFDGAAVVPLPPAFPGEASASGGMSVRAIVPPCLDGPEVQLSVEADGARSDPVVMEYRARRMALSLEPYQYTTVDAARLADCVELDGAGATYLVTGSFASVPGADFATVPWRLGVAGVPAREAGDHAGAAGARWQGPRLQSPRTDGERRDAQREFDLARRSLERGMAKARPAVSARGGGRPATTFAARVTPADPAIAPPIGSIRTFDVVAETDGSRYSKVDGVLEYVGAHLLVYTDASDARLTPELRSLVALMDRTLWGMAVSAFGSDPDVDGNGRIVVLFTPVVNALVRAQDCITRGFVSGFFYPPDLNERGAHSNGGEVFYAFVPDPTGRFSCAHTEREVVQRLQPTFLHEMEHLIAYNEHVMVRGGAPEETWLAEGLGRISEELGSRYFETVYPPPFGRGSPAQLFPDSASPFIGPLLLNSYVYLWSSLNHSVTAYHGVGSLEEAGATWLFVRWLQAQRGDGVLARLVQTRLTGIANVEAAVGERFAPLFGDFSLALFADSLPGLPRSVVPPRLRFAGLSLRRLMAREAVVQGYANPFPLATYLLQPGDTLRSVMLPGTMVHAIVPSDAAAARLRFSFTGARMEPFDPTLGAQVGILRLPP